LIRPVVLSAGEVLSNTSRRTVIFHYWKKSHIIQQLSVRWNISVICWQYGGSGHLHDGLKRTTTEISTTQTEVGKMLPPH